MIDIANTVIIVSTIVGGVYFAEDRFAHQDDLIATNEYIDQRFTDSRINDINRQAESLYNKEKFGIELSPYDKKQLEWLKFQLGQERGRAKTKGLRY